MQLSQKEQMLLEDLRSHEQMVIQKCNEYADQTSDPQLRQMFENLAKRKQQYVQKISQNLNQPSMTQQSNQTSQQDAVFCHDMLSTEKYLSSVYNTAIFEMKDSKIRQDLNTIQSDTQKNGEELFQYMQSKGFYNLQ
ncbi:MAG: spore coat protein [Desulfitobacteriia bacterium]|jgi:spore coat protein CotF